MMSMPGVIKPGSVSEDLVQHVDLAPTFLQLAGLVIPDSLQGMSMLPILCGRAQDGRAQDGRTQSGRTHGSSPTIQWRKAIYYHYYEYPGVHAVKRHYGIRTERYKLIHFYNDIDEWELYDLEKDPAEMNNLYNDPSYSGLSKELKLNLVDLQKTYQDEEALSKN
jgi:arylsulfatase A-like enzyme